ncbi:hypothetical protein [Flagellimonas flava]|uniref:hypothetical protein n=1 Tax=Flagellimonas flava TaxID=570519 RepID=UPI003D6463FD
MKSSKAEEIINQIRSTNTSGSTLKIAEDAVGPFDDLKNEISQKGYNKVEVAYVDEEVHSAFRYLKDNYKIPIGDLFSFLGEKWLEENSELLKATVKKNKFL